MNYQNFELQFFMESINQRFVRVLDDLGISGYSIAKEMGISQGTITNIKQGKNKPSTEIIEWILQNYRSVSAEYLLRGEGTSTVGPVDATIKQRGKDQKQRVSVVSGSGNSISEFDCNKLLEAKEETIQALRRTIELYERMLQTK